MMTRDINCALKMLNQVYQLSLLLIWLRTKKVNKHKICQF